MLMEQLNTSMVKKKKKNFVSMHQNLGFKDLNQKILVLLKSI